MARLARIAVVLLGVAAGALLAGSPAPPPQLAPPAATRRRLGASGEPAAAFALAEQALARCAAAETRIESLEHAFGASAPGEAEREPPAARRVKPFGYVPDARFLKQALIALEVPGREVERLERLVDSIAVARLEARPCPPGGPGAVAGVGGRVRGRVGAGRRAAWRPRRPACARTTRS